MASPEAPALEIPRSPLADRHRKKDGSRAARRCAWGLSILMVVLPLQWYSLGHGPLGTVRYFHIADVFMLLIARPPLKTLRTAARQARPVFPAAAMIVVLGTCTSIGWHSGATQYLQAGYYIFFGLVAAACLIIALTDTAAQRILAVASVVTLVVFVGALLTSIRHAGVNITSAVSQALAGNPKVLEFGVFKAAFATVAVDARSNLRHEVFGALVVCIYIGLVASSRSGFLRKTLFVAAIISAGLVITSLSRSTLLGVGVTALVGVLRLATASRIKVGTFLIGVVALVGVPIAIVKLLPLLSARFTSSGSYDSRVAAVGQFSSYFGERLLVGGPIPTTSTQVLVLDAMLRAGLVAGIAALIMEIIFVMLTMRAIALFFRTGQVQALAAVGAGMQLLVRSVAGGQNLMHEVEWFALALLIAVLYLEIGPPKGDEPSGPARSSVQRVDERVLQQKYRTARR